MTRGGNGRATLLVLAGLAGQEIGAAIAILLFPQAGPLGMVTLRLVFSALVLLIIARPRLRCRTKRQWRAIVLFGLALAGMNGMFYMALQTLPLGVAVTIEVLGPLTLSIIAAKRAIAWLWAGIAVLGVVALGGGGWDRLDPVGVLWALGAAVGWACYILTSARVGKEVAGLDGLALAMTFGALLALPLGIIFAGPVLLRPDILALGLAVALLSSTIPYALELIALRTLPASAFAILMSLGPATASAAGFLILAQGLTWLELAGIALVIVASIGAVRTAPTKPDEPLAEPVV